MTPTEHKSLEKIRIATGRRVRLQRWEAIEAVMHTDQCIMLMIDTYKVRVLVREDRYEAHGRRVMVWNRKPNGGGYRLDVDRIDWFDDFEPYAFRNFGRVGWDGDSHYKTEQQFTDDCYRPGTDANPMDNLDRTAAFPDNTPRMARHWKIGA